MRSGGRDLLLVLGVAWIARAVFVLAIGEAHSVDVEYWRTALATLDEGRNPYETGVLNWPPLWLVVIKAVDAAADLVGVGFWSALRIYLVLVESAVVVTLYVTLVSSGADRAAVRRALLIGIALNPVAIILVCQHGNSDVQIGLFVTLAVAALAAHHRSRDVVAWLGGCLFLGLGVLAKTVPLVLAPLLAPGARRVSSGGRALGVVLFLGPAALGTAVILVLAPGAVWHNVITYRSTRGYFGLAGMVREFAGFDVRFTNVTLVAVAVVAAVAIVWRVRRPLTVGGAVLVAEVALVVSVLWLVEGADRFGLLDARGRYSAVFTLVVALAASGAFVVLWRTETPPEARWLFLAAAVGLMVVVAFGPGYGPQYAYWFLPALVASYVLLDDGWRRLLRVAWLVAALTYAVEYAVVDYLGAGASRVFGSGTWTADVGDYLKEPDHLVVYRLPLFVVYLVLIAAGIDRLTRRAEPATPAEVLRSPSAAAV
ncbi:MAG TPA: hypothetical protein VL264_07055 [Gaiella sp.]|nr:hypothetical protein [Gaiella sp.]